MKIRSNFGTWSKYLDRERADSDESFDVDGLPMRKRSGYMRVYEFKQINTKYFEVDKDKNIVFSERGIESIIEAQSSEVEIFLVRVASVDIGYTKILLRTDLCNFTKSIQVAKSFKICLMPDYINRTITISWICKDDDKLKNVDQVIINHPQLVTIDWIRKDMSLNF